MRYKVFQKYLSIIALVAIITIIVGIISPVFSQQTFPNTKIAQTSYVRPPDILLSTNNREVGLVDAAGYVTTLAANIPNKDEYFTDIALSPEGELFGVTFKRLFQIDLNTGSAKQIGSILRNRNYNALDFGSNGILYGSGDSKLYSIDTETGEEKLVVDLRSGKYSSTGDFVFDAKRNLFWAISKGRGTDSLYTFTLDGKATKVGDINFKNVWGLVLDGDNNLLGYTSDKKQIILNKNKGGGTFQHNIVSLKTGSLKGSISGATEGYFPPVEPTENNSTEEEDLTTETITAPFSNGPFTLTQGNTYGGLTEIVVYGFGQASETARSDAFYIFTDNNDNKITPVPANEFGLYINEQPAQDLFISSQTVPKYNPEHSYTFRINAPDGPLTFGVGDKATDDNTGEYIITVNKLD
jgi:hypothetical protein